MISKKPDRAYLQYHRNQLGKIVIRCLRRYPFSQSSVSLSVFFVCVSHVAVPVEHNFTGSEESHRVICSSISAATCTKLMPYTGGPQDYKQTQPIAPARSRGRNTQHLWLNFFFHNSNFIFAKILTTWI